MTRAKEINHEREPISEFWVWYFSSLGCDNLTFWITLGGQVCSNHIQNTFKRGGLQSRLRIFLTGCKLFATIKILVILLLLATDLTSSTINYFF